MSNTYPGGTGREWRHRTASSTRIGSQGKGEETDGGSDKSVHFTQQHCNWASTPAQGTPGSGPSWIMRYMRGGQKGGLCS